MNVTLVSTTIYWWARTSWIHYLILKMDIIGSTSKETQVKWFSQGQTSPKWPSQKSNPWKPSSKTCPLLCTMELHSLPQGDGNCQVNLDLQAQVDGLLWLCLFCHLKAHLSTSAQIQIDIICIFMFVYLFLVLYSSTYILKLKIVFYLIF